MPDKLTDNDIKKALECCVKEEYSCNDCSYNSDKHFNKKTLEFDTMPNGMSYDQLSCDEWLKIDALDYINRLQAEKQNLEIELQAMRNAANGFKAENERLQNTLDDVLDREPILVERSEKYAKAEAYKEFAELLFKKAERRNPKKEEYYYVLADDIVDLLKELVGEDK